MPETVAHPEHPLDYDVGFSAGTRAASRDSDLDAVEVKLLAQLWYQRAMLALRLVETEYLNGFQAGYDAYLGGIV